MLYLYDKALAKDLERSFNPDGQATTIVKVMDAGEETVQSVISQIQNDEITFPLVVLSRNPDTPIDITRTNFTRMHRGVAAVLDKETNNLYYEKVVPIELGYELTVLTTSTADMDELVKELLFKYINMFFISFTLPYECKRKVRFGVEIDMEKGIERKSGSIEYTNSGLLHQSIIPLKCQGAVLVSYTPAKLTRSIVDVSIEP